MKILEINSVCGIKSTGRICTDLAKVLREKGHECKIAYGRETKQNISDEDVFKIGNEVSVMIHIICSRLLGRCGFYSKRETKRFLQWVEKYDPDVVHLHNLHGYYINIPLLFDYLKNKNKPIVWTLHDCWSFTGHCAHFDLVGCDKWKLGCSRCPQISTYPKSWIKDNVKRNYNQKKRLFNTIDNMILVTPSEWLADLVSMSYLKNYPVRIINNGIDLNVFRPTGSSFRNKHGLEDKKIILGVASLWGTKKGLDDFIRISYILDSSYQVVLVGLTEEQIRRMPDNILCIKKTNNVKELSEIYSISDVFVNPTKEDTFPTVNIEAIACGIPVVTYNTGGSIECINDQTGYVTKENSVEELVRLIQVATHSIRFNKEDCVKSAEKYDKSKQYEKYIELYESLVK